MATTRVSTPPHSNGVVSAQGRGARISVSNVSHAFSGGATPVLALRDVSLEIPSGQFVALVGASGCGKTTLLNMMAGLLSPLTGRIEINGDLVTKPTRHTGYMFARDALFPWRSALGNVMLGLEIRGISTAERRRLAKGSLARVGLEGFEKSFPRQLSQGMRQRVAVARTLAIDPDTLLMDEPFAALDAQTRIHVQAEFTRIWEETGKTVVFVTHDLAEAVLLADRVVVLAPRPGRVIADIMVDLDRPRAVEELRFSPKYQSIHEEVWEALKVSENHAEYDK